MQIDVALVNIISLLAKEQDIYDIKDRVMSFVCEAINCEVSLNLISPAKDEVYVIYSSLKADNSGISSIPLPIYSDFILHAIKENRDMFFIENNKEKPKAVFPFLKNGEVAGFLYVMFPVGENPDHYQLSFFKITAQLLGISLENSDLKKYIAESKMREKEMTIAFDMQQNIMSDNNIKLDGAQASFFYKYGETSDQAAYLSKRLGGDYCELIPVNSHTLMIFIADVMGHGMASNYFVPMMKGVLKTLVSCDVIEPGKLLTEMNLILMKELDKSNLFITAQAMKIDFKQNILHSANAGHTEPILINGSSDIFWYGFISEDKGLPLGIDAQMEYETQKIDFSDYDTVLLYTDGITEALNTKGEAYGARGMIKCCKKNFKSNSDELVREIYADLKEFVRDNPIKDDVMIVAVKKTET